MSSKRLSAAGKRGSSQSIISFRTRPDIKISDKSDLVPATGTSFGINFAKLAPIGVVAPSR